MDLKNLLRNSLEHVRKESKAKDGGGRWFVPLAGLLTQLKDHQIVDKAVLQDPEIREDERRMMTALVLESIPRILSILIYNGHEKHLSGFLYRRKNDSGLPYLKDALHFLPPDVAADFVERQWEFIPVTLKKGALRLDLEYLHILPYYEDTHIGHGGFGEVFRVKLHVRCQELLALQHPEVSFLFLWHNTFHTPTYRNLSSFT